MNLARLFVIYDGYLSVYHTEGKTFSHGHVPFDLEGYVKWNDLYGSPRGTLKQAVDHRRKYRVLLPLEFLQ